MKKPRSAYHRALWRRKDCGACGAPVIVAEERLPGGFLKATLLEAEPSERSILVRTEDGYVERDPRHERDGKRYLWHHCPERNG